MMSERTKYAMLGAALVLLLCANGYLEQQDFDLAQQIASERNFVKVARK